MVTELPQVFFHGQGFFLFRFSNSADYHSILDKPFWSFGVRPLLLKRWDPNEAFDDAQWRKMPIWTTLPGLPVYLWSVDSLGRIGSCLRTPICVDMVTATKTRILYSCILVELDVSLPVIEHVMIRLPDDTVRKQIVAYHWRPYYCAKCDRLGHEEGYCSQQRPGPAQKQVWKKKVSAPAPQQVPAELVPLNFTPHSPLLNLASQGDNRSKDIANAHESMLLSRGEMMGHKHMQQVHKNILL